MSKILLYKASAGSGKTFMLVYEYVKYLFAGEGVYVRKGSEWVCNVHRGVLAVTFTNKATGEMKGRILSALDLMRRGELRGYVDWLRRDLPELLGGVGDDVIRDVAGRLLCDLLNDFTSFRVQTIDGFFQQVVRSFANDFNLDSNYRVELDSNMVIERAVDEMLNSLGDADKGGLLRWMTEFVNDRVNADASWNPRCDIIGLSRSMVSERYGAAGGRGVSGDDGAAGECLRVLREEKSGYEGRVAGLCRRAEGVFERYGVDVRVPEQKRLFYNNSLSGFSYEYLRGHDFGVTDTFAKRGEMGGIEGYFSGANVKAARKGGFALGVEEMEGIGGELGELAREITALCSDGSEEKRRYMTARLILKNFYITGISGAVGECVERLCREGDMMMLSSTTELIQRIIDGCETPFVYERVGLFTNHFMIDEFQDTSREQWRNFAPLIAESLSRGEESMIVGDVKQSIYRWRNGDWRILYEGVGERFPGRTDERVLEVNYRSMGNVVRFNNLLYTALPEKMDEIFKRRFGDEADIRFGSVYEGAVQKWVDGGDRAGNGERGYVRCCFVNMDDARRAAECSMDDVVARLREAGCYEGVAVLARTNRQLAEMASRLAAEGIPFCSSEALGVADNVAVRFVVDTLRYVYKPYEGIYRARFVGSFVRLFLGRRPGAGEHKYMRVNVDGDWQEMVCRELVLPVLRGAGHDIEPEEVSAFVEELEGLRYLQLARSVQGVAGLFGLEGIDGGVHSPFIRSLTDAVHDYCRQYAADAVAFLSYWDKKGRDVYMPIPEMRESVILCTIHKSKGLQFKSVFLPFIDFKMGIPTRHSSFAFLPMPEEMGVPGGDSVGLMPVNMANSKQLLGTYFREHVKKEYSDYCLDELNALYVAMTRAENNLFVNVIMPKKGKDKEAAGIDDIYVYDLLHEAVSEAADGGFEGLKLRRTDGDVEEMEVYEAGVPERVDRAESGAAGDVPESGDVYDDVPRMSSKEVDERMSIKFSVAEDEENLSLAQMRKGVVLHKLFSQIRTVADADGVLTRAVADGLLSVDESAEVKGIFYRLFAREDIAGLFSDSYYVVNEGEIWDDEERRIYRPDRLMFDNEARTAVVVDYKFGERTDAADSRYTKQVSNYMRLISAMGYKPEGYVLYVMTAEVVRVGG